MKDLDINRLHNYYIIISKDYINDINSRNIVFCQNKILYIWCM